MALGNLRQFVIERRPKGDLFPELGQADLGLGVCRIRADLPEIVAKGVIKHEEGHLRFGTVNEHVAILYGLFMAPLASLAVVVFLMANREQRQAVCEAILGRIHNS